MTDMASLPLRRKFSQTIENWFHEDVEHPLLVTGARRTGKTYLLDQAGAELAGDQFVRLDFQTDLAAVERIFDGPTDDVDAIVRRLAEYKRVDGLDPSRALLFFDEVQLDERALNSLRFALAGCCERQPPRRGDAPAQAALPLRCSSDNASSYGLRGVSLGVKRGCHGPCDS